MLFSALMCHDWSITAKHTHTYRYTHSTCSPRRRLGRIRKTNRNHLTMSFTPNSGKALKIFLCCCLTSSSERPGWQHIEKAEENRKKGQLSTHTCYSDTPSFTLPLLYLTTRFHEIEQPYGLSDVELWTELDKLGIQQATNARLNV